MTGCRKHVDAPPIRWLGFEEGVALAKREHRVMFIYVSAEWDCAAKELERETFPDPRVRAAFATAGLVPINIDVTEEDDPTMRLVSRLGVVGEPALIVTSDVDARRGGPEDRLSASEFMPPDALVRRLAKAVAPMKLPET